MRAPGEESLQDFIWRTRYRDEAAQPAEGGVLDSWRRVAESVAAIEREPRIWRDRFLEALRGYRFLPGGRILAGAGTRRHVTLCNCFVMGLIDDSIEGIFESLKEGALTMQQGGGVGYDFSTLRPNGARARRSGVIASGPVSFMRVWDAMCATILSTGARRGAMMATLRCDHPDIEEFIDVKRASGALRHFNLSVLVSDEFLRAVETDSEWPLVFPERQLEAVRGSPAAQLERLWSGSPTPIPCRVWKRVRARALWGRLCAAAGESAEPGVLFIDRINAANNLGYCETLSAANPCGEEPLPPYGACNLGSLNLTAFVLEPFTKAARLDREALAATARLAVRFLDDVIEISRFPLLRQREQAHRSRRVGLGITGLADALAMLTLRYDEARARETAAAVMREIRDAAYAASIELARERGAFPGFQSVYLERPFIRRLPEELRAGIARHGIRNSHLLAIAPAGTISLLAGNVSSGIEPVFGFEAVRDVLDTGGVRRRFTTRDFAYAAWRERQGRGQPLPEWLVERSGISARDELLMQASLQPYVDGAISKTVALAHDARGAEVEELFAAANTLGLKGCTVFRAAARRGVIREVARAETAGTAPGESHCCALERECD